MPADKAFNGKLSYSWNLCLSHFITNNLQPCTPDCLAQFLLTQANFLAENFEFMFVHVRILAQKKWPVKQKVT